MLKKGFWGLLCLSCINVYAGTMGQTCTPQGVTTPCKANSWEIAGSALYLQTSSLMNNPVVTESFFTPARTHFIKTPKKWGFELEGVYNFNKGNDLKVNWLNFSEQNSAYYSATTAKDNYLHFSNKVNIVNIELAQKSQLGSNTTMRLFAGGQFASLKNKNVDVDSSSPPPISYYSTSDYNGGGPRLGTDFTQELPHGFNAVAQGAMSLLIGNGKGKNYTLAGQSVLNHRTLMVPGLDAKVGLGYRINMQTGAFNIMGGWMFQRYFSAINSTYGYSLNGPYIKAKWTSLA